jgi:hypothetical protein
LKIVAVAAAASISIAMSTAAAENTQKLSGSQIRANFTGMQLKVGKWAIEKDELCLYLQEPDDGCFEVSLSGRRIEMKPSGLGLPLEGVLQTPANRN